MFLLVMVIGGLGLAYMLYRAFPLTCWAIWIGLAIAAYTSFARDDVAHEKIAPVIGGLVLIAFCADIVLRVIGFGRGITKRR